MGTRSKDRTRTSKFQTVIRMGATKFTVERSQGGVPVSFEDLNHVPDRLHAGRNGDGTHHATENELSGVARHLCSVHGIGEAPRQTRKPGPKAKPKAPPKRLTEATDRFLSPLSM